MTEDNFTIRKASSADLPRIHGIDYDPGASEVNQLNRIKLMLATAQKQLHAESDKAIS